MSRVLAFRADPSDQRPLDTSEELIDIENTISKLIGYEYELFKIDGARKSDILHNIHQYRPSIVHFSGHGSKKGKLIFVDNNGRSSEASISGIRTVFSTLTHPIQCVVLNLCYSQKSAQALSEYCDTVIGMKSLVDDDHARAFSREFYTALAENNSVKKAFDRGVAEMKINECPPGSLPVLIPRPGVDPNQVFIPFKVHLFAEFFLDSTGKPKKDKDGNYIMEIWLDIVPNNISSVVYNFDDPEFEDAYEEVDNAHAKFRTTCHSYGNFLVRVILWRINGTGVGISCTLSEALKLRYKYNTNSGIIKAIKDIETH